MVRLVCAVLETNGRRVVGKTTGTEPCILLPDSPDEPVKRRGLVTILEQKKLVKRAVREGAESLVAEVMSLHEENHRAEAHLLPATGL